MRKTAIITFVTSAILLSCGSKCGERTTALYLVPDPTSDALLLPSSAEIVAELGLDIDNTRGAIVEISPVGEAGYEPSARVELHPEASAVMGNPFDRAAEVGSFDSVLSGRLRTIKAISATTRHSEVFRHVARMLNMLAKENAAKKEMTITSDLNEFTAGLDLYDRDLRTLYGHPERIERYFDSIERIGDLGGITVNLIYHPKDNVDSRRYEAISAVYRRMIERRGGKVLISGGQLNDQIRPYVVE